MVSINNILVLVIVAVYLLLVLGVGYVAAQYTGDSREDFFMADRTFGTLVLFFALFATNMTAVALIGAPSLGHEFGVGGYGLIMVPFIFLLPLFMLTAGVRIWIVGKRFGHITPAQIVNHRWNSKYLGLLVMGLMTFWTIPYILVGLQGAGIVFEGLTDGFIPYWLGALVIAVVVTLYLATGGMRGTGWTNTFQGLFFMGFLVVAGILVPIRLGGASAATELVVERSATHLIRVGSTSPLFQPQKWLIVGLIFPMAGVMFPQMFIRFMTGQSTSSLKKTAILYPVAGMVVWIPAVLIGFWSFGHFGMLDNPDFALPRIILDLFPLWVIGFVLAAILAALMSSIDAQVLTLSTFFTEDIVREYLDITERKETLLGRFFIVVVMLLSYVAALMTTETVVDVFIFAASGFALMFIPIIMGFYWMRSNKYGCAAGLIVGFVGLWAFELAVLPQNLLFGVHEFLPLLLVQIVSIIIATHVTPKPSEDHIKSYYKSFSGLL